MPTIERKPKRTIKTRAAAARERSLPREKLKKSTSRRRVLDNNQEKMLQELIAWRDRLCLTNREAAPLCGMSYGGFLNYLRRRRFVDPRTLAMARETERLLHPLPESELPK